MTYSKEDKAMIKQLKKAGVELTGEETTEELTEALKGIPADNSKEDKAISSITFKLRSGNTRTFSQEENGDDFEAIADEFEANNTAKDGGSPHKDYILSKESA